MSFAEAHSIWSLGLSLVHILIALNVHLKKKCVNAPEFQSELLLLLFHSQPALPECVWEHGEMRHMPVIEWRVWLYSHLSIIWNQTFNLRGSISLPLLALISTQHFTKVPEHHLSLFYGWGNQSTVGGEVIVSRQIWDPALVTPRPMLLSSSDINGWMIQIGHCRTKSQLMRCLASLWSLHS